MKNNKFAKQMRLGSLILGLTPAIGLACDMHGQPGRFGQFHPLLQQHMGTPNKPAVTKQPISLLHRPSLRTEAKAPASFEIDYVVPSRFEQVRVSFSASENIQIQDQEAVPLSLSGKLRVSYRALTPGQHFIWLQIKGLEGNQTVVRNQSISITAG